MIRRPMQLSRVAFVSRSFFFISFMPFIIFALLFSLPPILL